MLRRCGSGWDMKGYVDYNHKNAPGIHHSGDVMDDAAKRETQDELDHGRHQQRRRVARLLIERIQLRLDCKVSYAQSEP